MKIKYNSSLDPLLFTQWSIAEISTISLDIVAKLAALCDVHFMETFKWIKAIF